MSTKDFLGDNGDEASEDEEDFNPNGSPPASPEGEGDDLQDSSGAPPTWSAMFLRRKTRFFYFIVLEGVCRNIVVLQRER